MQKVIKDGKVAVIISPEYGSGWYSWNTEHPQLLFHPKLVEMVEQGKADQIDEDWVKENLGIKNVYCGGNVCNLKIVWLPIGTKFIIEEYDGSEYIITNNDLNLTA